MTLLVVASIVAVCGVPGAPQQTRLEELIRDVPVGEKVCMALSASRPFWDMQTVLSHSDAVVEGTIANVRSAAIAILSNRWLRKP